MSKTSYISIAILCSCAILSKYLVILPEYMVKYVGNAAWINVLSKCIIATISLTIVLLLYKPFAPMTLSEISMKFGGKALQIIFNYLYIIAFTVFNAILLRLLSEALSTVIATNAPDEFFAFFILVPVFIAAYSGTNPTKNLCCIIFPFVILTLFIVCLALLPHYRVENIMPIFGTDTKKLINGILTKHFGFTETVLLFFFAPFLGNFKEIKKSAILTFIIITSVSVLFTLAYCLTIPYPASKDFFLPFYQMTRMIKSGAFLQRLEPIVVFVWTSFVMCSMSVLISVTSRLVSYTAQKDMDKAFTPAITLLTFFVSMIPESESAAFLLYDKLINLSTILFPVIPFLLLCFANTPATALLTMFLYLQCQENLNSPYEMVDAHIL